jgi:three-Cys-motif partner protein
MMVEDDGLHTPEVGDWAERKYRLIAYYAQMFSTSMKRKWDCRAYIDLFAGAGWGRVRDTTRVLPTSALLALAVPDPFDRYVFCDLDPACTDALQRRVDREYGDSRRVDYLTGDSNELVQEILDGMREELRRGSFLSFCVVDPCSMANLKFSTIEQLSTLLGDFLVLIPSYMDAHRNEGAYLDPGNATVEEFLGDPDWREKREASGGEFGAFVVDQLGLAMKRLGFIYDGLGEEVTVYLPRKNVKLYHLAFYSKNELGMRFWRAARKGSDDQHRLFE